MNIVVILKMVPDVVEELEVAADGKTLDTEYLRMIVNERDEHALEEALLLKERYGGTVSVVAFDAPEVDDTLFTALAKGADRALKICDGTESVSTRSAATILSQILPEIPGLLPADLFLTGVQAIDDFDGQTAPLLSQLLQVPYVGIVTQVEVDVDARKASVIREYSGGVRGEFEVPLPVVLGIQAAEKPPRYVPVAKVRAAMQSQTIGTIPMPEVQEKPLVEIHGMAKPEVTGQAEMLEGSPEEVVDKICAILSERGVL